MKTEKETLQASAEMLEKRKKLFSITETGYDIIVPENKTVLLSEVAQRKPELKGTASVKKYKEWLGRPNALADEYPWQMPSKEWSGKSFSSKDELTAEEKANIEKAGWIYVFNDSAKVDSYEDAIENYVGSFPALIYNISEVIINKGGRLVIDGDPAVLLIDEITLWNTGQVETRAVCHITCGKIKKR